MLTFFAHGVSAQCWAALFYKTNRITASVSIYTMEDVFHRERETSVVSEGLLRRIVYRQS